MEKNIDKKVISERNLFGSEHFAHQVLSATLNGIYSTFGIEHGGVENIPNQLK